VSNLSKLAKQVSHFILTHVEWQVTNKQSCGIGLVNRNWLIVVTTNVVVVLVVCTTTHRRGVLLLLLWRIWEISWVYWRLWRIIGLLLLSCVCANKDEIQE